MTTSDYGVTYEERAQIAENALALLKLKLEEAKKKADLYEIVRRMNPRQFSGAWEFNLNTGKPLDEIISDMAPLMFPNKGE